MKNVFELNAEELEKLNDRVHKTVTHRNEGSKGRAAWEQACREFHNAYDRLAFPGGLSREFELLRAGDPEAIEMAIRYLEANPWYFRSGYYKADMLRMLRKHPLTPDQCERLRKVILERVRGRPVREMRAYAHLAPTVANPEFEEELVKITESSDQQAARHAGWVLHCLRNAKGVGD